MSKGTLKIHSENILPIIKKWLYSDKDIFIRELVSNATDAIYKLKVLSDENSLNIDEGSYRINIELNKEEKWIKITDTGIGMTKDEVKQYIAQLAFSGAEEFMKKYTSKDEKEQMIGHFGLGFYSAFMVSSKVEISTLSYKEEATGAFWSCDGSSSYTIKDDKREERGTEITLHINDESLEYLEESKFEKILSTYCSFLPYPIFLGDKQINSQDPLWLKKPSECTDEEYLDFYRKLYPMEQDPIFWVHLNVDYPFHLKGILYFPKIDPRFDFQSSKIKLFCNRVFVSDNCKDLFPDYLTILRGAIDSPDIPLNVSRSYLQMDSTVRKLSTHIAKKITDKLSTLHKNDLEAFKKYWPEIEMIIKLGMMQDEKFYERAKNFLLWKVAGTDEHITAEDAIEATKDIVSGKVFYTQEDNENSSFLKLYREKNLKVLLAKGPLDNSIFNFLEGKLEKTSFQRIDGAVEEALLDSSKEKTLLNADGKSEASEIASSFKSILDLENVDVEAKSLSSTDLPAFVMIDEKARRMRDYLSMTQKEIPKEFMGKQTLVINTNNALINSISKLQIKNKEMTQSLVRQIYDLSLLSQKEMHPESINSFISRSSEVMEKLALMASES